jgi:anti-sigma regulatory factor (Ser/Thr protein kinase)
MPVSVRTARLFICDFCNVRHLGSVRDIASLLTSELITNAVTHGASFVLLEAGEHEAKLHVAVSDDNPDVPVVGPLPPDAMSERGRGLLLVAVLAASWGVELLDGGGKAVWFELDLTG